MKPKHIALIGDSIFDNGGYVDEGDSVIEQLNLKLVENTRATLLAVDGDIDVSLDGSLMVCSTYAGSISIFKMDQGQSAPYEIGNGGHAEYRRWLVWKNEHSLLAW